MKSVNKEIAKTIEKVMSHPFTSLELAIDGHAVTLVSCISKRRLTVAVYVDGWIRGRDLVEANEIGQRFWRPIFTKPLRPKSEKPRLKKLLGPERLICYSPDFSSPRAFIAHINKTCQSVALKAV